MRKIVLTVLLSGIILPCIAQEMAKPFERLLSELEKHAVDYSQYKHDNMPILMGNTEMGGLADPLGRGMFETWVSDLWVAPMKRESIKGFMLQAPEFINQSPREYHQNLSLINGELKTKISYENDKGYESSMFFSMDDKHKMVYKIKNTGKSDIYWIMNIPYDDYIIDYTDTTIIKGQVNNGRTYRDIKTEKFTYSAWSLQVDDLLYRRELYGKPSGKYSFILEPNQEVEFKFSVYTHRDGVNFKRKCFAKSDKDYNKLLAENNTAWLENWQNTGIVFLPEHKHMEIFYRSVFWLYSTCGEGQFLQAEAHFAKLTPSLAAAYGYYSKDVILHNDIWGMHPFTYGAPGQAAYSFIMIGNQKRAENILSNLYKPEILHRNVTEMFTIGNYKLYDHHKYLGEYNYLNKHNPLAICFGHELTYEGENYIPTMLHRYDWQVHINAFATSLYYRYADYFNDSVFYENTVYPVLRGVAEFWSELLNYNDKKDIYELPVVLSLSENLYVPNPIDGILAAKWCLIMASDEAEMAGIDKELRGKWKQIAKKIHVPQNDDYYLEFNGDPFTREGGGYQGVRGFSYLSFPTAELMAYLDTDKANKTLEKVWERNKYGEGVVAFTISQFAIAAAYFQNAELAYQQLSYSNTQLDPSGTAMMEVDDMRAYYLDNYASYVTAAVSMLLQSYDDKIIPFAAIPEKWKDVEFYDLPASKGIRVSGKMENGKVEWVKYYKDDMELTNEEIYSILK